MKKVLTLISLLSIILISCSKDKTPQPNNVSNSNPINVIKSDSNKYSVIVTNESNNSCQMNADEQVIDSIYKFYWLFGTNINNQTMTINPYVIYSDSLKVSNKYNSDLQITVFYSNETNPASVVNLQFFINNKAFKDTTIIINPIHTYLFDVNYNSSTNKNSFNTYIN